MQPRTTLATLALLAILTTPHALAQAIEPVSTRWISVTPTGLAYTGPASDITLELHLDNATLATQTAHADGRRSPYALEKLIAQAPYAGSLAGHEIAITLRTTDATLLEIRGQPSVLNDTLGLRITRVDYPAHAPLAVTKPVIFLIDHGWNDERLRVGFAWTTPPTGRVTVNLTAEIEAGTLYQEAAATQAADQSWSAEFHLDHLPAVLPWTARIYVDGKLAGTTGSRVAFPTRSASDGFFTPEPGGGLVAAGGFHDVGGHRETIQIHSTLLAPTFEGHTGCPDRGAYDTLAGETWRIANLSTPNNTCNAQDPAPPSNDSATPEIDAGDDQNQATNSSSLDTTTAGLDVSRFSMTPSLLVKILLGVVAVLGVAYLVVSHRGRKH